MKESDKEWGKVEERRKRKASEYAQSITADNFGEWRERILIFSQTESDDLATFPFFYQFLGEFAAVNPTLALDLVLKDTHRIERFLIPLLRGLWAGDNRPAIRSLINDWIKDARYLNQCIKMFLSNPELDAELIKALLEKAKEIRDTDAINMAVSVAVSNYDEDREYLLTDVLMPAIQSLTEQSDARWILESWFRRETRTVFSNLNEAFYLAVNFCSTDAYATRVQGGI